MSHQVGDLFTNVHQSLPNSPGSCEAAGIAASEHVVPLDNTKAPKCCCDQQQAGRTRKNNGMANIYRYIDIDIDIHIFLYIYILLLFILLLFIYAEATPTPTYQSWIVATPSSHLTARSHLRRSRAVQWSWTRKSSNDCWAIFQQTINARLPQFEDNQMSISQVNATKRFNGWYSH